MKILVDKMPESPSLCLFGMIETYGDYSGLNDSEPFVVKVVKCRFNNRKCKGVKYCHFLQKGEQR